MAQAEAGIGNRQGIVSFFDVNPLVQTRQGHIDIVYSAAGLRTCGTSCFWLAKELWFWQLKEGLGFVMMQEVKFPEMKSPSAI